MYGKLKKNSLATSSMAASFKLGEYNLLPTVSTILMFWFINCEKFNSGKRYLPSDSHTNTVISDHLPTRQDGVENCDKAYCLNFWLCLLYACFNVLHVNVCFFKGLEKISTKKRNDVKKQVQKIVEKRYTKC